MDFENGFRGAFLLILTSWLSLFEDGFDARGHGLAQEIITFRVEVNVVGILHLREMPRDGIEKVVDDHFVLFHQFGGGLVLLDNRVGCLLLRWVVWYRCRSGPDKFRAGTLHL